MRSRLPAPLAALTLLVAILQSPTAQAAICDGISSASDAPLTTVRIVSGLSRPLLVTAPPGDVDRLFVLEQDGRVRIVDDPVKAHDDIRRMAIRYTGKEKGEKQFHDTFSKQVRISYRLRAAEVYAQGF